MPEKAAPGKLDAYLEEISHFLSGREEREEILAEIRSHILEKAEREFGAADDAALAKVIAAYGPARRVAERYFDGRPIIAPAYRRYLFRYTTFLFAIHAALAVIAVAFKESFVVFPFLFIPRLNVFAAIMYLPTAFLTDLGIVALVLYFITQSGKEIRLPWPKFAVDIDEVRSGKQKFWLVVNLVLMLAITGFALDLYIKHHTLFFVNFDFSNLKPLLMPRVGQQISLIVIAGLSVNSLALFTKLFTPSRWVDALSDVSYLAVIGLLVRQPYDNLFAVSIPAAFLPKIKFALTLMLLFIALMITIDLVKNLIIIGRRRLTR